MRLLSNARMFDRADIGYLNDLLIDQDGRVRILPAAELKRLPHVHVLQWLTDNTRYSLPTLELVEFLRARIAGRRAIEIGAGMGDLGRALGILMTDSYMQMRPEMQLFYGALGAPTISPPADVEKLEALAAVQRYGPKVVVASWVTQLYQPGDEDARIPSSAYGVDEQELLRHVDEYNLVGNLNTHQQKRIFALPHEVLAPPWLVSRGFEPEADRIWIWKRAVG